MPDTIASPPLHFPGIKCALFLNPQLKPIRFINGFLPRILNLDPSGISCTGRSQRDLALGKEILPLAKKPCSWQGDLALGKETLLLAKRSCFWQRNPDLGKEILLLTMKLAFNKDLSTIPLVPGIG